MLKEDIPGSFEQLVLLAVLRLRDQAYGMTVRAELEKRTGQPVSLGAVYTTLERLEGKGYLTSRSTAAGRARGARPALLQRREIRPRRRSSALWTSSIACRADTSRS
jgi:hypothetical protein